MEYKTKGTSIQTFTGKMFYPLWPTPDSMDVEDIAHALGFMPRFGGHTKFFYSVAQHCVIMSRWFRRRGMLEEARWALHHEDEEGLGFMDLPRPVKYLPEMTPYRVLGKTVQYASWKRFGLIGEPPAAVKELDTRMGVAEAKVLMKNIHPDAQEWIQSIDTSDIVIKPYRSINSAKRYFLREHQILGLPS